MREQLLGQAAVEISAALAALSGLQDVGALRLVSMIRCAASFHAENRRGGDTLDNELAQNLHAVMLTPDALVAAVEHPDLVCDLASQLWPQATPDQIARAFKVAEELVAADLAELRAVYCVEPSPAEKGDHDDAQ